MQKEALRAILLELEALAKHPFPKVCQCCGRNYDHLEDFLARTNAIPCAKGLFECLDTQESQVVDLIRCCPCGTTLMVAFEERRDMSERGKQVRAKFGELSERLKATGLDPSVIHRELLRVLHGEDSEILKAHSPDDDLAALDELSSLSRRPSS